MKLAIKIFFPLHPLRHLSRHLNFFTWLLSIAITSTTLNAATTEIVTINNNGDVGNFGSTYFAQDPAISANGRYALFLSEGDLLLPDGIDDNGFDDIYLRDLKQGINELISVANDGSLSNGWSEEASMCARAKKVVFASSASNLTSDEFPSNRLRIFLRDRKTWITSLISPVGVDTQSDTSGYKPYISEDCQYIAYEANNQLEGSSIKIYDVRNDNTITLDRPPIDPAISGGSNKYASVDAPVLSKNGRFVAFLGSVNIQVPMPDYIGNYYRSDVFLHDRDADGNGVYDEEGGTTTSLITDTPYVDADAVNDPDQGWNRYINISGNGQYVIFCSRMAKLVEGDSNGFTDTYIYDAVNDHTSLISKNWLGQQGNDRTEAWWQVYLSYDGRYAAFSGWASNLVPEDTFFEVPPNGSHNRNHDVFLLDRDTDNDGVYGESGATALEMITLDNNGQQQGGGWDPMVTDNGRRVIFGSFMSFDAVDTNGTNDGYVRDRKIPLLTVTRAVYSEDNDRLRILAETDLTAGTPTVEGYGPMKIVKQTGKRIFWKLRLNNVSEAPESVTVTVPRAWMSLPVKTK